MAGGAPSRRSDAIASAVREAQSVEVDPSQVPPMVTESFVTGHVATVQHDEERADEGDQGGITQPALVELHMTEPPMVAQLGSQIVARGGTQRTTKLIPQLAIALGESLVEDGKAALASMKEQPLESSLIIASPAAAAATAAAADAVNAELKGGTP